MFIFVIFSIHFCPLFSQTFMLLWIWIRSSFNERSEVIEAQCYGIWYICRSSWKAYYLHQGCVFLRDIFDSCFVYQLRFRLVRSSCVVFSSFPKSWDWLLDHWLNYCLLLRTYGLLVYFEWFSCLWHFVYLDISDNHVHNGDLCIFIRSQFLLDWYKCFPLKFTILLKLYSELVFVI